MVLRLGYNVVRVDDLASHGHDVLPSYYVLKIGVSIDVRVPLSAPHCYSFLTSLIIVDELKLLWALTSSPYWQIFPAFLSFCYYFNALLVTIVYFLFKKEYSSVN